MRYYLSKRRSAGENEGEVAAGLQVLMRDVKEMSAIVGRFQSESARIMQEMMRTMRAEKMGRAEQQPGGGDEMMMQ